MSESNQIIQSKDGLSLFTYAWIPPQYAAVICLIHGFGEHIERYHHVAAFFNENGYAVVGMDNRGHGKSDGLRGHTPSFEAYMDDIDVFLTHVRTQLGAEKPLYLYGHSMGGLLVLSYLLRRNPSVKGIVATGPWIQLAFEPNAVLIFLGKLMRSIWPTFTQDSGLVQAHISRDPSVVAAYSGDKWVHGKISAAAGMGLREAASILHTYDGKVNVPLLIMHGSDDKLTSQPASEAFANRVSGDVTYRKWDGLYHEIHNEPEKESVFNHILQWLAAHP